MNLECGKMLLIRDPACQYLDLSDFETLWILIGMVGDTQFGFYDIQAIPNSVHFAGIMQDRLFMTEANFLRSASIVLKRRRSS